MYSNKQFYVRNVLNLASLIESSGNFIRAFLRYINTRLLKKPKLSSIRKDFGNLYIPSYFFSDRKLSLNFSTHDEEW